MNSNTLYPPSNVMRVLFLYVGQGEATLFLIPDGNGGHLSMLVDCNRSSSLKGIDLENFLSDTLRKTSDGKPLLNVFVNTHPHADHLGGLDRIRKSLDIQEVWHSGHNPGRKYDDAYRELKALIKDVQERGGKIVELLGSRSSTPFGRSEIHVLAPAEYVTDEIADEDPDERYRRIHEHCAVLRIRYGSYLKRIGVLITGDSDKTAWKEHITDYHGNQGDNRIAAEILSASHHGSRSFFKDTEEDEDIFTKHMDRIAPKEIVISAPDKKDSPHDHPHDDALELYRKYVSSDHIHHMGSRAWSYYVDISDNGTYQIYSDRGEIADAYPATDEDGTRGSGGNGGKKTEIVVPPISRVERSRPMG